MSEEKKGGLDRRAFLKTTAVGVAAAVAPAEAGAQSAADAGAKLDSRLRGDDKLRGNDKPPPGDIVVERPGSDFMVDVIKSLDLEYISTNPGSSFRSIQESLVNYGGNKKPELLTCMHEEAAVAIAHGYAKAAGKPMAAIIHGTVGLQHG